MLKINTSIFRFEALQFKQIVFYNNICLENVNFALLIFKIFILTEVHSTFKSSYICGFSWGLQDWRDWILLIVCALCRELKWESEYSICFGSGNNTQRKASFLSVCTEERPYVYAKKQRTMPFFENINITVWVIWLVQQPELICFPHPQYCNTERPCYPV